MTHALNDRLAALGLRATSNGLADLVATATKKRWGLHDALEHLADLEEHDRARRGLERRTSRSKLAKFKPIVDFDWNWPKKIDRALVESVVALDFIEGGRNVVLVAPAGLGKTMIAQNIVHRAVLAGHSALFITASELLLDLAGQDSPRALENRLRHYAKIGVLAIDEVGFLPFDSRNADLLFQVVSRRYERKSVVLTTNLAFAEWNTVFPNAACATALIERLVHHSDIITIEGESYRVREAERSAQERRTSLRGKPKRG
ncbi:MAG: IS21-like element helper ATPase IstB [Polyangiales bacterium]